MGKRAGPNPRGALSVEDVQRALLLAEKLLPSIDGPEPVDLTRDERHFFVGWLQRIASDALEAYGAGLPRTRSKHVERYFWVAMDFHTRTGRHRAGAVAAAWEISNGEVRTIASRWRTECELKFAEQPREFWRTAVDVHLARRRLLQQQRTS